jgi:hypothetical protein
MMLTPSRPVFRLMPAMPLSPCFLPLSPASYFAIIINDPAAAQTRAAAQTSGFVDMLRKEICRERARAQREEHVCAMSRPA